MQFPSQKGQYSLHLKCITWYKDSHSLFDYESTKVSSVTFDFPMVSKNLSIYRKRDSISNFYIEGFQVVAVQQSESIKYETQDFQLLTRFATIPVTDRKIKLNFSPELNCHQEKKINENERLNTDESNSSQNKTQQQTYLIVRKLKKENGEYLGYKLEPGQIVKLGRVEFFVSETCIDGKISTASSKNRARVYSSRNVMKYDPASRKALQNTETSETEEKPQCKICLEQADDSQNFLFNPCVCAGSCGTVHLECLTKWIHFKVKKQVVGGTQHYNFEKFKCEVCKTELPMIIDINGLHKELLPIEKPQGNYLILEGACDKEKSVIMIQNIPNEGIKLGRGHECQIRITDISVSRNHGLIKNQPDGFYIYDNKSKFGTLVRDEKMEIEISKMGQGVQVGRTVVSFELRKDEVKEQQKISKSTKGITEYKFE